ncbi:MAG: hypothetical protein OEV74_14445 [Cyclobacteriaceae bacterium]|nr:hypothetical protein [Cyclobacteriaceae bacterium]MDH4297481.1 hypothetical protein [Cyclobacteriaceae bacterium]MDH5247787.1 hypothetical protein [Cyclobacteriaceae bacterium]
MLKRINTILSIVFVFSLMLSCSEESNPEFDIQTFTTIFDNNKFDASFFPIEMRQTADGGYIVLGGRKLDDSNFTGIYLLKADKFGNFVKEIEVEETSVNPVAKLTEYQTKYYFFCMDPLTQQAQIANVDANLEAVTITPVQGGLTYPAAASFVDNSFILLGYNNGDKQTVISIVNPDGGILSSKGYSIGTGEDIEEPIIKHYIRTGRQYPFEVGKVSSNLYFFNGFFNYTFSLVFTDMTSDDPVGVVQGQQADGGFSALTPLGGNKFASSRFNFGENFLIPNKELSTSGITSTVDLGGYSLPELVPNANVRILRAKIDTENVLIYGSDTKSKQIGLLFYEEATGTFISSRYLGFSNPFEIASLTQTSDEGLAVCGTTYVAGRFPRICIFKLSKEQLASNLNK